MVERRDRAPVTRFVVDLPLAAGSSVELPEAAAHHARVKRLAAGDAVSLTDGGGRVATGAIDRIAKAQVTVAISAVDVVPPASPLELFVPVGDRDRMLWLAEKATELGVTAWRPVMFARSRSVSPRGEGEAFSAKVRARMVAALEQSGGAWLPVTHPVCDPSDAAHEARMPARYLLQVGARRLDATHAAGGAAVILGPEGGMTPGEQAALAAGGWEPATLAAGTLRFETAALAALAIIRASHLPAIS